MGNSDDYGLHVYVSSATIQLVSPLTKEQVSVDNGGGGNWGAEDGGDVNQIKTIADPSFPASIFASDETKTAGTSSPSTPSKPYVLVRVPEDCSTLKEAVKRVHEDNCLTSCKVIIVGVGEHQIDGRFLEISSAMSIVGESNVPKEKIVVLGGIYLKSEIQGNCHLRHLTLRQAKGDGVRGYSSFIMEDILVEQCDGYGVYADGTGVVGRCTNVEVRQCEGSGVVAYDGASITLIGAKTTVHNNCTDGDSDEYGLQVYHSSSTIQFVTPLTKEQVAIDNGGGGNWGAGYQGDINLINTIPHSITSMQSPPFTQANDPHSLVVAGETKDSTPATATVATK